MVCGPFDNRRGGHRCVSCRRLHKRCDGSPGKISCSYCIARFLKCSYSIRRPREEIKLQLDLVRLPTPPKAIIFPSWKHTTVCFEDAFGDLPQFSVLRSDAMVALSQQDHDVNSVIELAGEVHIIRASGPFELEKQLTRLRNLAHKQLEICARQMRYYCKARKWASGPIACALILMAVHSVLDKYFDPVASLMPIISGYVDETQKQGSELCLFDEDLIRLAQLTDSVNAVSRSVCPFGPDFTAGGLLGEILSASHTEITIPSPLNNDIDHILEATWRWGSLQGRMFDWLAETINDPFTQLSAEQRIEGLEIVCEASSLQMRLLQCFLQLSKTSESNYQLLASYSYWVLISISQLLRYDSWKSLQCDLPVMVPNQLHEYALENVGCIATIMNRAGLLNGLIVPLLFSMGLEMVSYEDQRRVLDILDEQRGRNFPLSGLFRRALLDAYAGQATRRYSTVSIRLNTIS